MPVKHPLRAAVLLAALSLFAAVAAVGGRPAFANTWSMYQQNVAHTGFVK